MSVVVDASAVVALVTSHPSRALVGRALRSRSIVGDEIHAPELLRYEVASALTQQVAVGLLPIDQVPALWQAAMDLDIIYHPLTDAGGRVVEIARTLQRRSAYDAAYLALGEELGTVLWTIDASLVRNGQSSGFNVEFLG